MPLTLAPGDTTSAEGAALGESGRDQSTDSATRSFVRSFDPPTVVLEKLKSDLAVMTKRDCDRQQKIENILHDMVEAGKLRFHPPNMWSVV
jgi:hypothetical protein